MLDPKRKHFVTASQAHRVMSGFEKELSGKNSIFPGHDNAMDIAAYIEDTGNYLPLVGELKEAGIVARGIEIKDVSDYMKSRIKVFSEGMESVAREIAMYSFISERDERGKTKDMERGNIQEGEAVLALSNMLDVDFESTGIDQLFFSDGFLGVTPDGVEYDGFSIKSCAEVKNPMDLTHMKYLSNVKDAQTLLDTESIYYWQAQTGLAVTGADVYHWASYHNGFNSPYDMVYVAIKPNKEHIDILKERAERVSKRVPDIIKDIKSRFLDEYEH